MSNSRHVGEKHVLMFYSLQERAEIKNATWVFGIVFLITGSGTLLFSLGMYNQEKRINSLFHLGSVFSLILRNKLKIVFSFMSSIFLLWLAF